TARNSKTAGSTWTQDGVPLVARRRRYVPELLEREGGVTRAGGTDSVCATDSTSGIGVESPKTRLLPTCNVTGTTKRWLPLDGTISLAVSVSPSRRGTAGTDRLMVAARPLSLARLASSHGSLLVAWAESGRCACL